MKLDIFLRGSAAVSAFSCLFFLAALLLDLEAQENCQKKAWNHPKGFYKGSLLTAIYEICNFNQKTFFTIFY